MSARTKRYVIDRYIARSFVAYFLVCSFAIVALLLVIQTFQALKRFLEIGFPGMFRVLAIYYLYNVPIILSYFFPMMILVGASYCLVAMARDNEMVALKASGVSLYRIVLPIFISATIIAILAAANQQWLLPILGPEFEAFSRNYKLSRGVVSDKYGATNDGRFKYRVFKFNVETSEFQDGDFRWAGEDGKPQVTILADAGTWQGGGKWLCRTVHKTTYLQSGEQEKEFHDEYLLEIELNPDDLLQDDLEAYYRSIGDLRERIRREPERIDLKMELHRRFTHPISAVILLLIGLHPIVGSERLSKNRVLGIGVSIMVGGAFFLIGFVCEYLAGHQYIPTAALAAWLPVIMFGALGVYFFDCMRT